MKVAIAHTCKVTDCNKKVFGYGYCSRHYHQLRRFGFIKGNPKRTCKDSNEIIKEENVCRIKLYNKLGEEIAETIIDLEDYDKAKKYKWSIQSNKGHVGTHIKGKSCHLDNIILGASSRESQIDHKDRNPLNNRKDNLRICSIKQNGWNRGPNKNSTTGLKGVSRTENTKWRVSIQRDRGGSPLYSKVFTDKEKAIQAYNKEALKIQGQFAYINPIN